MKLKKITFLTAALLALLVAVGCGGSGSKATTAAGNGTDRAFVAEMVPHHQSAIKMAKVAEQRGESPFVKRLAASIIKTQDAEIGTMKAADAKLADAGVQRGTLDMPASMMGMDMDTKALESADPFDRAFLQMMIPHHEGAVAMAKVELDKGKDAALKQLAQQIIDGQQREITEMRQQL